jgi:hypothetical protein
LLLQRFYALGASCILNAIPQNTPSAMSKKYYLLLLLPLLGMAKCEKEPAPVFALPAATQHGANTIGFMIDGRVWRNYGWLPHSASESANLTSAYFLSGSYPAFRLSAGQSARNVYELFHVELDNLQRTGTYQSSATPVPGNYPPTLRSLAFTDMVNNITYSSEVAGRNSLATITITRLDTAAHIIAGTFTGTLKSMADTTKIIRLTDGRFDVNYQ